jgi:ribonuclease HI
MFEWIKMSHWQVFTDGSVNTQLKVGYGAYLVVATEDTSKGKVKTTDALKDKVKIRRFKQTSSTKLELQTLLWALHEIIVLVGKSDTKLTIYTDSQNIIGLPSRKTSLEQSHYYSSKNKRLNHYELYQEFYRLTSSITCKLVKVSGHQLSSNKNDKDRLFSLVDKASRRALRAEF